ncbi:MAG: cytochrome c-type biogenesis CcmF C-terminal domain-containing protein, partial [Myxococcota bacterium]
PMALGVAGGLFGSAALAWLAPGTPGLWTQIMAGLMTGLCVFVIAALAVELQEEVQKRRREDETVWQTTWQHLQRTRRRYGGYLVHVGVVFVFLGFAGYGFRLERSVALAKGEWTALGNYVVQFKDLKAWRDNQKKMFEGFLRVHKKQTLAQDTVSTQWSTVEPLAHTQIRLARDPSQSIPRLQLALRTKDRTTLHPLPTLLSVQGKLLSVSMPSTTQASSYQVLRPGAFVTQMVPARHKHHKHREPTTEVALKTRLFDDIYAILVTWEALPGKPLLAHFKFYLNPLIFWIWFGGLIMLCGAIITLLPTRKKGA